MEIWLVQRWNPATIWLTIGTCLALASAAWAAESGTEIHVSPAGDDTAPGTRDKPLATPQAARAAVRRMTVAGLQAPVTVYLAGGTYELPEPLTFGPEDSGTERHAITWSARPGEKVVFSGGRRLGGWTKGPGEVWRTTVAGAADGNWPFRQLWVRDLRAVRARTPNADASRPFLQLQRAELSKDNKTHAYSLPKGVLQEWTNLADVEAVVFGEWEITRKFFRGVDVAAGQAQMAGPHAAPHENIAPTTGRWFFIENALEALDEPGEWYLDRKSGEFRYWPRPGEDLAKAAVVAPRLARLLEVKGTAEKPVRNLHFRGLAFHYADWAPPPGGYLGIQACHYSTGGGEGGRSIHGIIDAAIRWDFAEGCGLHDCEVAHVGGCGVELVRRCRGCALEGNLLFDISGNGVTLGGPAEEADVPKDTRIVNNVVRSCGVDYPGADGVWVGFAQRTLIAHNEMYDLPYTGISLGWQWDANATPARQNTVEYNHVHDVMRRLSDGAGIYTLGLQPDSVIRGNHIHDVRRHELAQGYPNNGMFLDQGSTGFTIEENLIHDTAGTPLRFHQAGANLVRNNVLAVRPAGPIEFNVMPAERIQLENNTLVEVGKPLPRSEVGRKAGLEGPYRKRLAASQPTRPSGGG